MLEARWDYDLSSLYTAIEWCSDLAFEDIFAFTSCELFMKVDTPVALTLLSYQVDHCICQLLGALK